MSYNNFHISTKPFKYWTKHFYLFNYFFSFNLSTIKTFRCQYQIIYSPTLRSLYSFLSNWRTFSLSKKVNKKAKPRMNEEPHSCGKDDSPWLDLRASCCGSAASPSPVGFWILTWVFAILSYPWKFTSYSIATNLRDLRGRNYGPLRRLRFYKLWAPFIYVPKVAWRGLCGFLILNSAKNSRRSAVWRSHLVPSVGTPFRSAIPPNPW